MHSSVQQISSPANMRIPDSTNDAQTSSPRMFHHRKASNPSWSQHNHNSNQSNHNDAYRLTDNELNDWKTLSIPALIARERAVRDLALAKKEEARQLVGDRYRVLIDCADSIAHMKNLSINMTASIDSIPTFFDRLQKATNPSAVQGAIQLNAASLFTDHIRNIVTACESIYSAINSYSLLEAVKVYTRAQLHLRELTHLRDSDLPVLSPLNSSSDPSGSVDESNWSLFVYHFATCLAECPKLILARCEERLADYTLATEDYCEAIVTLTILSKNSTIQSALEKFINSRISWIYRILSAACSTLRIHACKQATSGKVVRAAICTILRYVQVTIVHCRLLFGSSEVAANVNVLSCLSNFCNEMRNSISRDSSSNPSSKGITEQPPNLKRFGMVTYVDLQSAVLRFINDVKELLMATKVPKHLHHLAKPNLEQLSLPALFSFLHTGKQLGSLRDAALSTLCWETDENVRGYPWSEAKEIAKKSMKIPSGDAAQQDRLINTWDKLDSSEYEFSSFRNDDDREQLAMYLNSKANKARQSSSSFDTKSEEADYENSELHSQYARIWEESIFTIFPTVMPTSSSANGKVEASRLPSLWETFVSSAYNDRCFAIVESNFARVQLHDLIVESESRWSNTQTSIVQQILHWDTAFITSPIDDLVSLKGFREQEVRDVVKSFERQLSSLSASVHCLLHSNYLARIKTRLSVPSSERETFSPSTSENNLTALLTHAKSFVGKDALVNVNSFISTQLSPHIQRMYDSMATTLVRSLRKKLTELESGVLSALSSAEIWRSPECMRLVEQALFVGLCCYQIMQQPSLKSVHTQKSQSKADGTDYLQLSFSSSSSIVNSLSNTFRSAIRVWTQYVAVSVSEEIDLQYSKWMESSAILSQSFKRNGLLSSSESSVIDDPPAISIPFQASPYVCMALFMLESHIARVGGNDVEPLVLQWLFTDVSISILAVYENKWMNSPESEGENDQVESSSSYISKLSADSHIQLLFDLNVLFGLLRLPESKPQANTSPSDSRRKFQRLCTTIEKSLYVSGVDSIDWESNRVAFATAVQNAFHRNSVLFGTFQSLNPLHPITSILGVQSHAQPIHSPAGKNASDNTAMKGIAPVAPRIIPLSTSLLPTKIPHPVRASSAANLNAGANSSSAVHARTISSQPVANLASIRGSGMSGSSLSLSSLSTSDTAAQLKEKGRALLGKFSPFL